MSDASDLWNVGTNGGFDSRIGPDNTVLYDIAMRSDGALFAVVSTQLFALNPTTGGSTLVGSLSRVGVNGLAFSASGDLLAAGPQGDLLKINPANASSTIVGSFGGSYGLAGDLAFAPDGRLFASVTGGAGTSNNVLVLVNPTTGSAQRVGSATDLGSSQVFGLAWVGTSLFGLTAGYTGCAYGALISIDTVGGGAQPVRCLQFRANGATSLPISIPPSPPPSPPTIKRIIVFVHGINTNGKCNDGDADGYWDGLEQETKWIAALVNSSSFGWVREYAGLTPSEGFAFAYYPYTSDSESMPDYCPSTGHPRYDENDTCWSIDDRFDPNLLPGGEQATPHPGQASRFAAYLDALLAANPEAKLDVLVHSQGAAVSLYALSSGLPFSIGTSRVRSVITIDGVVNGIHLNTSSGIANNVHWQCPGAGWLYDTNSPFDSPHDMVAGNDLMDCLQKSSAGTCRHPSVPLYTIDLKPGDHKASVLETGTDIGIDEQATWQTAGISVGSRSHTIRDEFDTWCPGICLIEEQKESEAVSRARAQRFIGCALSGLGSRCADFASAEQFRVQPALTSSYTRAVAPAARSMRVTVTWPGSTVITRLVSPSGRAIDASPAQGVTHASGSTWETFEVDQPEAGDWTVEMFGADVPVGGEDVVSSLDVFPDASVDLDGDGVFDAVDNCLGVANGSQYDVDGDTLGDACDPDIDGDTFANEADNCVTVANTAQTNTDGNFIDLHVFGKLFDDITVVNSDNEGDACDPDIDNDGLPNDVEAEVGPSGSAHAECVGATGPTNPLLSDTDDDLVIDGAECAMGTDPVNAASKPPAAPVGDTDHDGLVDAFEAIIGTNPALVDTDGDRLLDSVEFKGYMSDPLVLDTDFDICSDGREAASINDDVKVNSLDMVAVASHFGPRTSGRYIRNFDVNKDGNINSIDMLIQAKLFTSLPC